MRIESTNEDRGALCFGEEYRDDDGFAAGLGVAIADDSLFKDFCNVLRVFAGVSTPRSTEVVCMPPGLAVGGRTALLIADTIAVIGDRRPTRRLVLLCFHCLRSIFDIA